MNQEDKFPDFQQDPGDSDDVEILEVVGLEVDAPPGGGGGNHHPARAESEEEVLLAFDDEDDEADTGRPEGRVSAGGSAPDFAPQGSDSASEELLLRLRADYDNLRKRIDREREEFELHANATLVGQLLPVLDNFERALGLQPGSDNDRAFREGFVMIHKQLIDELRRGGLRAIESVGQPFDPNVHDAVATDDGSSEPHNTIVEELRRGYLFQDRVLRPAMVKVSTNDSGSELADGSGEEP